MEKIVFTPEGEAPVQFYVLEQTRLGGVDYILVTDSREGPAPAGPGRPAAGGGGSGL